MAEKHSNAIHRISSNQHFQQQQLFSLISMLSAPRRTRRDSDVCRLIVDSRLQWAVEPIDGESSWLYLPEAAQARTVAGCTVLTAN